MRPSQPYVTLSLPPSSPTPLFARRDPATGVMAGRFEHFETQMVDQEDQGRVVAARAVIRQESRREERKVFAQARNKTLSSAPAPALGATLGVSQKVSPKPRPKLPSFVQTAAVERKRPHSELSQATANTPQKQAPTQVSAPAAPEVAVADVEKASAVSSLVAYGSSDDEDEPAEG